MTVVFLQQLYQNRSKFLDKTERFWYNWCFECVRCKMNEMLWNVMVEELAGAKFSTFGLYTIAEMQTGSVSKCEVFEKLTERLYVKSSADRFAEV